MALGDGGLDAQVEQRMDAYRGNPQKLQQRYGQNKELLDLLALQKLTSEKKQVAADMQLKAENNPNTIAQQREAEALQLTKSAMGGTLGELAGRTKGTLDQKNALQKQNMGKLAQRAAQPNAGGIGSLGRQAPRSPVNPQAGGLGNARMMQAQKQAAPVRMAGGGIVAFAAGEGVSGQGGLGGITQEQIDTYRKTEMRGRRAAMTDAQIRAVLMERAGIETSPNKVEKINQPMNFSGVNTGESVGGITNISKPTNQLPQDTGVLLSEAVLPPAVDNSTAQRPDDGSGIAGLTNPFTKAADPAAVDNSFLGTENETNVNAAMQTGFSQGDAQMRRDEANQSYEDMKSQLAAFDQENYGQNEDLSNFLIGMGGTGSAGAAMRGGKSAMDAGVKNRRNRLMDNLSLEVKRLGNDAVLGAKGIELGKTLAANAQSNENNIRSNVTEMTKAGMARATQAARLLFDQEKATIDDINKDLDRQVNVLQDDTNRLNIRMTAAYKVSNDIANLRSTLQASLKENPPYSDSLITAGIALEEALEGGRNREIAAAKATVSAIQGEINVAAEKALNSSQLLDLEESANNLIRNQVRKSDSSTNFSGATIGGYKE
tara:strand:- start:1627 stop:3432 length:1806 start_codon:yes stop_codon:yes gene_type:complete